MKIENLLVTGAAGGIATALRPRLPAFAERVVLSDIASVEALGPHESFIACNLADAAAVNRLVQGMDAIIHLGGISIEKPFAMILDGNIIGAYNLFEAARNAERPRIVFASSNHVVGFHRRDQRLDTSAPPRPDTLYGVSKAFGEALASYYHDKFGQECLSVRIGSCFPAPIDRRMLATWLAIEDFADLCACALLAPRLGHTLIYGVSDNDESWWDNREAMFLGWRPKHSSARWRADLMERMPPQDPTSPAVVYQGGQFCVIGHPG